MEESFTPEYMIAQCGHGAYVMHEDDENWCPYVKLGRQWYEVTESRIPFPVDEYAVASMMKNEGFQLFFEGV